MKNVVLVSICGKKVIRNKYDIYYSFHFKGYLNGQRVTSVEVCKPLRGSILVGEEYVMFLEVIENCRGVLRTKLIKYKELKKICYVCK
ncbi:hypothetical protein [Halobacteriovorax sp. HLS]|uniref:hypothetical protein n=1 Tax=Halobacteriovorax sp. HLS TaxID=2234000 RepID=UPI000FD781B7|nr:hypothetical protein [Halobacteriovorax sp. HLS]